MTLWILAFLFFLSSIPQFRPLFEKIRGHFLQQKVLDSNNLVIAHLRFLKESLESGLVPTREEWMRTETLPKPWGELFSASIQELRSCGAPILPTLERMIQGMEEETALLLESKMRSAQAFSQVLLSTLLIPMFAILLYFLLPELNRNLGLFLTLVSVSLMLGVGAFYWMLQMMEGARYGNVSFHRRGWILSSRIFFEHLMGEISGGHPPDIAWSRVVASTVFNEGDLLQGWGIQIWEKIEFNRIKGNHPVEVTILQFGCEMRRAIQQSIVEGMGVLDRLESIHRNFQIDLKMKVSRELQLLPNHCLKPLFILVFPSVMLMLFGSLGICFGGNIP